MFITKGLKTLGMAVVPILIFSQTAMAAPSMIIYQNAASQNVQASYLSALSNAPMKTALETALSSVELANLPLFVTDTNGSVIDYEAALGKSENYATALTDPAVNKATAPVATYQMNTDGTVTLITAPTVVSLSAATGTTVVGTAFALPAQVTATMSDNTTKLVDVTWAAVPTTAYAVAGSYTVVGTIAESATVTALATVTVTAPVLAVSSVSAINGTVNTGGSTGFTFKNSDGTVATPTGVTYSVTSSNAATGFFNNGVFTATAAGTYTIQAAIGTTDLTTSVTVIGSAASVTLSAASTSFAASIGTKVDTVTATVVDASGNTLSNYSGVVQAYISTSTGDIIETPVSGSGAGTLASPYVFTATKGQVTLTLDAAGTQGTDVVYVGVPDSTGAVSNWQTISLSAVAPSATTIKADSTTPKSLAAGAAYSPGTVVVFHIYDQSGNIVSTANYNGTVTLSGPAQFPSGGQTSALSFSNGNATAATFVTTSPTTTGTITLTPTVNGLTGTPVTINVYSQATNATQLSLSSQPTTTAFTADAVGAATTLATKFQEYAVQAADAKGNSVTTPPTNVNVTVLGPDGNPSAAVGVWNGTYTLSTATTPVTVAGAGAYTIDLGQASATIPAGTYTVKIADATLNSTIAPLTETFTVTAGLAHNVVVTPSASPYDLQVSSPSTSVSAQLVDAWGNNVAQSGAVVDFAGTGNFAPNASQVATNANGIAMVTATDTQATPAAGDIGTVTANIDATWKANHNDASALSVPVASGNLTLISSSAASIIASESATTLVSGGTTPTITTSTINSVGAPVSGDTLKWSLTGPTGFTAINGTVNAGANIIASWPATLNMAGTYTVTLTDSSQTSVPAVTKSFTVTALAASRAVFFQNSTVVSAPIAVAANSPITLTVESTDANNNPVMTTNGVKVTLSDGAAGGAFALTQGGAPVTTVTILAGQTSVQVYYVKATAGSISFSTPGYTPVAATQTLSSAAIATATPTSLVLTYSGALIGTNVPANTDYKVTVDGNTDAVTGVTINAAAGTVTLTLTGGVTTTAHTVTVSYTPGAKPLQDANLNNVASLSAQFISLN